MCNDDPSGAHPPRAAPTEPIIQLSQLWDAAIHSLTDGCTGLMPPRYSTTPTETGWTSHFTVRVAVFAPKGENCDTINKESTMLPQAIEAFSHDKNFSLCPLDSTKNQ